MPLLQVQEVSKQFGDSKRSTCVNALKQASLELHEGQILAVLGLNGAGKTTLVKLIAGLLAPDTGRISIFGETHTKSRAYLAHVGAVFEGNRNIYWRLTTFENLEYFGVLRGLSLRVARMRATEMLKLFNLEEKRTVSVGHLSRGMQQRLAIAIALIHRPQLIVLDEPTLGIDIENVMEIVATLKTLSESGISIILTSHQLDVVKMLSDRIVLLVNGRVAADVLTVEFLLQANNQTYYLTLLDAPSDEQRSKLQLIGVEESDGRISCDEKQLYTVVDLLRPLRIGTVNRGEGDFTKLFMTHVRGTRNAELIAH